eukprot:scaffold11203_cov129-Isochrysis_galbana.AAC.1
MRSSGPRACARLGVIESESLALLAFTVACVASMIHRRMMASSARRVDVSSAGSAGDGMRKS